MLPTGANDAPTPNVSRVSLFDRPGARQPRKARARFSGSSPATFDYVTVHARAGTRTDPVRTALSGKTRKCRSRLHSAQCSGEQMLGAVAGHVCSDRYPIVSASECSAFIFHRSSDRPRRAEASARRSVRLSIGLAFRASRRLRIGRAAPRRGASGKTELGPRGSPRQPDARPTRVPHRVRCRRRGRNLRTRGSTGEPLRHGGEGGIPGSDARRRIAEEADAHAVAENAARCFT
jgi:hypothetical protein